MKFSLFAHMERTSQQQSYVDSYDEDTIDEFLDHMKTICAEDWYDAAFGDLANCFDLAIIDEINEVNLEELERDYFIFKMIANEPLVKIGKAVTKFALNVHLPVEGLIR